MMKKQFSLFLLKINERMGNASHSINFTQFFIIFWYCYTAQFLFLPPASSLYYIYPTNVQTKYNNFIRKSLKNIAQLSVAH